MNYSQMKSIFEENADEEKAAGMAHYMRDQFSFYGIQAAARKALYKDFLKEEKKERRIDWAFLDQCYSDPHREFQYFVCDYLTRMVNFLDTSDLPHIRKYVVARSWWDTIDSLCKVIGKISLRDKSIGREMLIWAGDKDLWVRRTAIEYQLGLKEKTDTGILEDILVMNFGSDRFFINKAIGWALRDYSKTDPEWVSSFISRNMEKMSSLSIREGSKYL